MLYNQRRLAEQKIQLLKDFTVPVTDDIVRSIEELSSDELALDRYVHTLLRDYLYKGEL